MISLARPKSVKHTNLLWRSLFLIQPSFLFRMANYEFNFFLCDFLFFVLCKNTFILCHWKRTPSFHSSIYFEFEHVPFKNFISAHISYLLWFSINFSHFTTEITLIIENNITLYYIRFDITFLEIILYTS